MNCERARERFSEYLEGNLDLSTTALVRGHIEACDSCSREYNLFRQTWSSLGSLPEVSVPANLRHDVIMRMARMQHERRHGIRRSLPSLSWDLMFRHIIPARAVAVALTAAALALVLLGVPETTYDYVASRLSPKAIAPSTDSGKASGSVGLEVSPFDENRRVEWQNRKLGRNTLWIKVDREENGSSMTLYRVSLSINHSALLDGDDTARIGAQVHLLPPGHFDPNGIYSAQAVWDGNILRGPGVQIPVLIDQSQERGGTVGLLITWRFRDRNHSQVVFIPAQRRSSPSPSLGFPMSEVSSGASHEDVYTALRKISRDFGVPIIVNSHLAEKPPVLNAGGSSLDQALRNSLESISLDWLYSDRAVYVDRKYDVNKPL